MRVLEQVNTAKLNETVLNADLEINELVHEYRVAMLSVKIAKMIWLDNTAIADLFVAAAYHDIGKCMIDKRILNKPGILTESKKAMIKKHVEYGAKIGVLVDFPQKSISFILGHHENFDGTGYPYGVAGGAIPLGARIIKICDVYDALCMDRAYRKAFTGKKALEIMEREKPTFDPELYEIFKEVIHSED